MQLCKFHALVAPPVGGRFVIDLGHIMYLEISSDTSNASTELCSVVSVFHAHISLEWSRSLAATVIIGMYNMYSFFLFRVAHQLWVSQDLGVSWTFLHDNVTRYHWRVLDSDMEDRTTVYYEVDFNGG